jgi:predicted metal-dependent peptidase
MNAPTTQLLDAQALKKMTRARASLILDQPFFGTLALRLHMIENVEVKELKTNGRYVMYNPAYVNDTDINQIKGYMAKEVLHCVYNHPGRIASRKVTKWNKACDYVVSPVLIEAGFQLTPHALHNPAFDGMSAEHIYTLLEDDPDDPNGDNPGENDPSDLEPEPNEPALTPQEVRDWKIATTQAANEAKKAGQLSAGLQKLIDEELAPKVDWRALLREFVTTKVQGGDYDWTRPNKRMMSMGFCLPTLHTEKTGTIAVFKDISCSIDAPISMAFSAEIKAICEDLQPEALHVLYVDTEVQKVEQFDHETFVELDNVIGGGTDFRPPFTYVEKHGIEPLCAIYLTDLEGPFPASEPDYPVLWCTINDLVAPWGDTVKIDVKD